MRSRVIHKLALWRPKTTITILKLIAITVNHHQVENVGYKTFGGTSVHVTQKLHPPLDDGRKSQRVELYVQEVDAQEFSSDQEREPHDGFCQVFHNREKNHGFFFHYTMNTIFKRSPWGQNEKGLDAQIQNILERENQVNLVGRVSCIPLLVVHTEITYVHKCRQSLLTGASVCPFLRIASL